jgi:hypothetical protein
MMPLAPMVVVRREFLLYKSPNRFEKNSQLVIHPGELVGKRGHSANEGYRVLVSPMSKSDAYLHYRNESPTVFLVPR